MVNNAYKINGPSSEILREIWSPMNPNVNITIVSEDFVIDRRRNRIGSSMLKILDGTCDTRGVFDYQRGYWRNEFDMHIESGICIATFVKKITMDEYFSPVSCINVFLIILCSCLIAEKIFCRFLNLKSIDFTLDTLRALIGNSTLRSPKNFLKRVFFIVILLPLIILSSFVQSELSSFFTATPTRRISLKNSNELMCHGYKVCSTNFVRQFFPQTQINNFFHTTESLEECYGLLGNDDKMTYATDCVLLRYDLKKVENVKILPILDMKHNFVYFLPTDYPLLPRLRSIYSKLFETGIILHHFHVGTIDSKKSDKIKFLSSESVFKMGTFYYFLKTYYLCALLIFCAELLHFQLLRKLHFKRLTRKFIPEFLCRKYK